MSLRTCDDRSKRDCEYYWLWHAEDENRQAAEAERDRLREELATTVEVARRAYRCAQHLAIMHRRENRIMEGAEGELAAITRVATAAGINLMPPPEEDARADEGEEEQDAQAG